ncbi:hypothetical protein L6452_13747 [Arctium lappa]|uniref:Uncharacterized protein n=1 Tax=Arctium lappa TaxID=4217 RepID=A0ACB9CJ31_ARCLA|nr:hypothetical protein L6452_13747 [Arctium lappa]
MSARFSYEELKTAKDNFCKKLGEGGFGSVLEGTLEDGSNIAVQCVEGRVQVKKSFVPKVESISNIHHVNLVRLRGFCALKSQQFLVYEFMSKGSLYRWIYHGDREHILKWECRKKIVLDIAKDLCEKKVGTYMLYFRKCWEEGKLLDIVDRYSASMQANSTEVVEVMNVVSWCLQIDFTRPSMSLVIEVLEGSTCTTTSLIQD